MANHGYLGEGFGRNGDVDDDRRERGRIDRDNDRGRDRDRGREGSGEWFGGRERGSERGSERSGDRGWDPAREGWGSGFRGGREQGRGSDFSRNRGDWAEQDRGSDRGMFDRARETARSWMSDDDESDRRGGEQRTSHYGSEHRQGGFQGDFGGGRGQGGFGGSGDWRGGRHNMSPRGNDQRRDESFGYNDLAGTTGGFGNQRFGSTPHDHYLSWRERQIAELDRDYQDYCREREQSFHQDFDSWRQTRQGQAGQQSQQGQQPMMGSQDPQQSQGSESMTSGNAGSDTQAMGQAGSTSAVGTSAPQEPLELTDPSSAATLGEAETPRGGRSRG